MAIKNTKIIGLTGMSGAGKTTACDIFRKSNFEIIDCDKICRIIVQKGKPCLKEIAEAFGDGIIDENGELNRKETARIIFSDKQKRLFLNRIMYPYVSYNVIKTILSSDKNIIVIDAPTLFESGIDDICDIIVSVVADRKIVLDRIMTRDGLTSLEAENRLKSQHDKDFYIKKSDLVIENNGDFDIFVKSLEEIAASIKESR